MNKLNKLKLTSIATVLAATGVLITATSVNAAEHTSVLERISKHDNAPVSYKLGGKNQAESDFKKGILTSAVTDKKQVKQNTAEYKVRYQMPVMTVPTRSEFRNNILNSATSKPKETAEFSRFELIEE